MSTREFPALGFDPAPGTISAIQQMVDNLGTVAKDLGEARDTMLKVGQGGSIWEGKAAEAFHGKVGEVPGYLAKAHQSLGDAAKVLEGWANDLNSMQRTAADYETQAEAALRTLRSAQANPNLGLAGQQFDTGQALREAQSKYDAAKAQVDTANADLEHIHQAATRLLEQHQGLADEVAKALRKAKDEAPEEPGFFGRIGEWMNDIAEGIANLAKDAWQFIKDHADLIAKIGDVLSAIGTVLSVVAVATSWIPGVNAVTAAAAVGVSAAAMGTHLLAKAAGADVSWTKIGFDAIGMIPGGGSAKGVVGAVKVLPKAIKAGKNAAKFAEEGSKVAKGISAATKTISRAGVQKVGANANLVNNLFVKPVNKVAGLLGREAPLLDKLAVRSVETGGKTLLRTTEMVHTAHSGAAVIAGAAVETVKQGAVTVGKWEAQPYIDNAKDNAMSTFQNAVSGR
jgi:phage shock protein A